MKVHELINTLRDMPLNSEIKVIVMDDILRDPMPESVWNDIDENYVIIV